MSPSRIFVIRETPSLAAALEELFRAAGYVVTLVPSVPEAELLARAEPAEAPQLLVAACNGYRCEAVRRWSEGPLRTVPMIVVGTRDPELRSSDRLRVVPLPLAPGELLRLIERMLSLPSALWSDGWGRPPAAEPFAPPATAAPVGAAFRADPAP